MSSWSETPCHTAEKCGELDVDVRRLQVVKVQESHRPNDCRLEVAVDEKAHLQKQI